MQWNQQIIGNKYSNSTSLILPFSSFHHMLTNNQHTWCPGQLETTWCSSRLSAPSATTLCRLTCLRSYRFTNRYQSTFAWVWWKANTEILTKLYQTHFSTTPKKNGKKQSGCARLQWRECLLVLVCVNCVAGRRWLAGKLCWRCLSLCVSLLITPGYKQMHIRLFWGLFKLCGIISMWVAVKWLRPVFSYTCDFRSVLTMVRFCFCILEPGTRKRKLVVNQIYSAQAIDWNTMFKMIDGTYNASNHWNTMFTMIDGTYNASHDMSWWLRQSKTRYVNYLSIVTLSVTGRLLIALKR